MSCTNSQIVRSLGVSTDASACFYFKREEPLKSSSKKEKWYFVTKIVQTYCEKKNSSDREKLFKFETERREFAKFLRSHEQFIQTVKGQNYFW